MEVLVTARPLYAHSSTNVTGTEPWSQQCLNNSRQTMQHSLISRDSILSVYPHLTVNNKVALATFVIINPVECFTIHSYNIYYALGTDHKNM